MTTFLKIIAVIAVLALVYGAWVLWSARDLGNSLEEFDEAGTETATTTTDNRTNEESTIAPQAKFEKPTQTTNVDVIEAETNGLKLSIPKTWKVEQSTIVETETGIPKGLSITSSDYSKKERTVVMGDEQLVLNGIHIYVSYQPEAVVPSLESPENYFKFLSDRDSLTSNILGSKKIMAGTIPLHFAIFGFSPDHSNQWAKLEGRNNGKKVEIIFGYTGEYSERQTVLDQIIASIEFTD